MSDTAVATGAPQMDVVDLLLDPEIQAALNTVVQHLPKLAKATSLAMKACDVTTEIITDGDLLEGLTHAVGVQTKPVVEKMRACADAAREAKIRAEQDTSRVSLFGLLRLLKDPTVQKNLRFIQAFLTVLAERDVEHRIHAH